MAEPLGRDPRLDNSMRCCRQFGQPGRSIAEICAADIGLNSGMVYRADVDSCGPKGPTYRLEPWPFRRQEPCSKLLKPKKFIREG
jgi:hypothetical protein